VCMCVYGGIIQFRVDCVMWKAKKVFRAKGDRATGDFCVDLGPNVRVKMRVGRRPRMYANIGLPSSPSPESDRETTDADEASRYDSLESRQRHRPSSVRTSAFRGTRFW
jgi:hypothetical protein